MTSYFKFVVYKNKKVVRVSRAPVWPDSKSILPTKGDSDITHNSFERQAACGRDNTVDTVRVKTRLTL